MGCEVFCFVMGLIRVCCGGIMVVMVLCWFMIVFVVCFCVVWCCICEFY